MAGPLNQLHLCDRVDDLLDVGRVLVHLLGDRLEGGDLLVARGGKLGDRKRVPVEEREPLVERPAQRADLLLQQLGLDSRERVENRLVRREHRVERLDVRVVLVLLQRHVERRLGHGEAHPIQVLGLADEHRELLVEVDDDAALGVGREDVLLQAVHRAPIDRLLPLVEFAFFVVADGLGDPDELLGNGLALLALEHLVVERLELGNRLPDAQEERVRPVDRARQRRLVLRERRVLLPIGEEPVHMVQLGLVLREDVGRLALDELRLRLLRLRHRAELLEQVEGALGVAQLVERVVHELLERLVDRGHILTKLTHRRLPRRLVAPVEEVKRRRLERYHERLDARHDFIDALRVARDCLELRPEHRAHVREDLRHVLQVSAALLHVACAREELVAVKLPPVVAPTLLDLLAHVQVGLLPGGEHLLRVDDEPK